MDGIALVSNPPPAVGVARLGAVGCGMAELLAYEDRGSGPPVVFLHGITADRRHWEPVVDLLVDDFRCISVDALGHGASPRTPPYDLFAQVGALGALLDDLDIGPPVLVGHSAGAFTATMYAAGQPTRAVVNVDQRLDIAAFRSEIEPLGDRLRGDDFDAAFGEILEGLRIDLVPPERQAFAAMQARPDIVLGMWDTVLDTPPAEMRAQIDALLPAVTVPYLAIFGDEISDEERRILATIPSSEVEVWPGLGHFVQLVDPQRTADRIRRFLDELPTGKN